MKITPFALLYLVAVAGCASYDGRGLRPGVSTEAEVRALMGPPAYEYGDRDGSRHLAFPRGPLGTQTFYADLSPAGVVQEVRPVLGEASFNRIQPGLTREQVLHMLGPPGDTMEFQLSRQVAWDYRFVDTWGYTAIFSVSFDAAGIVVSKFTRRIERDRSF